MRILVAFKVTPDYEALRDADWARVAASDAAGTRYVRRVLNVFDESALELALRLRDAATGAADGGSAGETGPGAIELEAVTVGLSSERPVPPHAAGPGLRRAPCASSRPGRSTSRRRRRRS